MTVWGLGITKGVDIDIVVMGINVSLWNVISVHLWSLKVGVMVDFLGDQIWTDSVQKIGAL
jgi:hypothetical protein